MAEVIFTKQKNGLGIIKLNRPKSLNALSYNMIKLIHKQLKVWEHDEGIVLILFESAGDRAFCAGGDIKELYEAWESDELDSDIQYFLEDEYKLDLFVHKYPKPIIANMDGVIMGGGVGLVNGATYRIATEQTKWAMPESTIGYFTDVGAAYFLNKAPGYIGRYLALTGKTITGKDVIHINAGEALIPQINVDEFFDKVINEKWQNIDVHKTLTHLIEQYDSKEQYEAELIKLETEINKHFKYETVEEIVKSLQNSESTFVQDTLNTINSKSPLSLKIILKQQIAGKGKSITQCLETDTILAHNFIFSDEIYEGIRSVLIERDNNPQYKYKTLAEVDESLVNSYFTLD